MPASQHQNGEQGSIIVCQPADAFGHANKLKHSVKNTVILVKNPHKNDATGTHCDIARHKNQCAHHGIWFCKLFEHVRKQQAPAQINNNVPKCIAQGDPYGVAQISKRSLRGEQPVPIFKPHIII
ncbi:hypothetical protein SDC9_205883 [bioreactor metagenome]|uniref:Uncharacterized protein n=1 Tax=bioreactor metagenome TaxID=1076179 RepID=A0A645J4X4_9ZZZZ